MYLNHPQVSSCPVGIGGLGLKVTASICLQQSLSVVSRNLLLDSRVIFARCERLILAMGPIRTGMICTHLRKLDRVQSCDLRGVNLSGLNLEGAGLRRADLSNANLSSIRTGSS